jgi:superfamily II DNA or RNA helicase
MVLQDTVQSKLRNSSETALIDGRIMSNRQYRPSLILNDRTRGVKVITSILNELNSCESFSFSIAFITKGGLELLSLKLAELKDMGIKGRIITTDYLNFNDPDALEWLLHHSDIEVRIYEKENFHTKGYIFHNKEFSTVLIGSSNITQNALTINKEWNLKITSLENGELLKDTVSEFEKMWSESSHLTDKWIEDYRSRHMHALIERDRELFNYQRYGVINPNQMQEEALCQLDSLRRSGKNKAILISATGTGKTFLSAFDVRNYNPKKVLFLVHREQILDDAKESYILVLGSKYSYGKISGSSKDYRSDILFSTIQSMSKKETLEHFSNDYFDYIVCDEAHHSTAKMYDSIINYFKPKFMLGMTATPERMDQADVFRLFDYNIAYELRLQKAMEMDMLCPFHYYGITDVTINGKVLNDENSKNNFELLTSDERVKHIIEKAEYFLYSGNRVKGLIFCSTNEEAKVLSEKLNNFSIRKYRTIALSAKSTMEERESAAKRLEQDNGSDSLDYILTCDIFNEGIDIPNVNQIIMLRPTESAIVFVQQLGRGLRKAKNKEFTVVIDFIGNYKNNFMIPVALSGDRTCNKDIVRKYLICGNDVIPGCSSVNFDKITKERIYESINKSNFTDQNLLKKEYLLMKVRLGKCPTLLDLYKGGSLDPRVIIDKYGNLNNFKLKIKEEQNTFSDQENEILSFISEKFINGKRSEELQILDSLIKIGSVSIESLLSKNKKESLESAISILSGNFYKNGEVLIERKENKIFASPLLNECLLDTKLKEYLEDSIQCGIYISEQEYNLKDDLGLVRYQKYSRGDVCRILNWQNNEESTIYGYKIKYNTCPIFVTYNKDDSISDTTKYNEGFIDQNIFSWMTRSNRNLESSEVIRIKEFENTGLKIPMFIKKNDDEGIEFYYLGQVDPILTDINQTTISGKSIVNIPLKFRSYVRDDIYEYFVT